MLVLDTHALVWLDEGNPRLGEKALQTMDRALASGQLGVASISFLGDRHAGQEKATGYPDGV